MEFQRVVERRRMVRNFAPREVPAALRERIVANALRGPSAGFSQGVELLVCHEPSERARFWAAVSPDRGFAARGWPGVYNAGLVLVPLAHRDAYLDRYAEPDKGWTDRAAERWPIPFWYVDAGFAALLALLTVVDAELGALFFGIRDPAALRTAFGVPEAYEPIGVVAIGYPAPDRPSRSLERGRRPLEMVVHRGRW